MRNFLIRLATFNKRDLHGLIGWFLVGIAVGLFALPIMVVREYYQYKHYHLAKFEWEDVVRYSIMIVLGSIINYFILGIKYNTI